MRFGLHRVYLALCSRKGANDTRENHRSKRSRMTMTPTKSPAPKFYNIALPVPLPGTFEYRHPTGLQVGLRVKVPFSGRELIGIVVSHCKEPATAPQKIKSILSIIDSEPVLPQAIFDLCLWSAQYYLHPIGEVFAAALPGKIKQGAALTPTIRILTLASTAPGRIAEDDVKRSPKQLALLRALVERRALSRSELNQGQFSSAVIKALIDKGLARWQDTIEVNSDQPPHDPPDAVIQPTLEQQLAIDSVALNSHKTYLLYGVTGSGKTEVYLRLIDQVLRAGRQALILVPEIALTPQTLTRFEHRFGRPVVALHSNLPDQKRSAHWRQARSGQAPIIIGTRSAIFTPLARPGIIIVDEEHDSSYKQQDGFHYSARDLASVRGVAENIPVILGSATPSLESLHNVATGKYTQLLLESRANGAARERYEVFPIPDNQKEALPDNRLFDAMAETLDRGEQVLVMRNRRGYAPVLFCSNCRWIAQCNACDARLTVHKQTKGLKCHHCGQQHPIPSRCPACQQSSLLPVGDGTQRLQETFQSRFPSYPVIRIDSDSTQQRAALTQMIDTIQQGNPSILLGTQLIAKGHHFPNVTLAIILEVDQGFLSADFRAIERTAQLILQTGGRSGRENLPGKVYLSSRLQALPELRALIKNDYLAFSKSLMAQRETYQLPPFTYQGLLRADAREPQQADQFLRRLVRQYQALDVDCEVLGPTSPVMEQRAGWYRSQLLVNAKTRQSRHRALQQLSKHLTQQRQSAVRWSIDVDPVDLF